MDLLYPPPIEFGGAAPSLLRPRQEDLEGAWDVEVHACIVYGISYTTHNLVLHVRDTSYNLWP